MCAQPYSPPGRMDSFDIVMADGGWRMGEGLYPPPRRGAPPLLGQEGSTSLRHRVTASPRREKDDENAAYDIRACDRADGCACLGAKLPGQDDPHRDVARGRGK